MAPGAVPVPLDDLLGHRPAVTRLRRALASGQLGHALLCTGSWPGGLATHPDLWLEDSDDESIRIRRVRAGGEAGNLQDFLSLRPYAGGARVAIVARAERLTEDAANSLLKTIEEPPPRTHLLLSAHSPERLPATIVSRCQGLTLTTVDSPALELWLRDRHGFAAETAALAAELAAGRPGRALRLAASPEALNAELSVLDSFLAAGGGGPAAVMTAAGELAPGTGAEGRERLLLHLSIWAAFVRDAAVRAAGAPELARLRSRQREAEAWGRALSARRASLILDALLRATAEVAAYAQPRLLLETLFLETLGHAPAVDSLAPVT